MPTAQSCWFANADWPIHTSSNLPPLPNIFTKSVQSVSRSSLSSHIQHQPQKEMPPSTRRQWKASEKRAIIVDYELRRANGESSRSIARTHGIQSTQLRRWVAKKTQLQGTPSSRKRVGRVGRVSSVQHLEEELISWVLELRESNIPIHYKQLVLKVSTLDHGFAHKSEKAQYEIIRRLCVSNELVLRRGTHVSQANPQEKRDEATDFVLSARSILQAPGVNKVHVLNMDQSPCFFSMHPGTTLHLSGDRTVAIASTSTSTVRITIAVGISASGDKLRSMIIFKGTPGGRIATREIPKFTRHEECSFKVQENAWMDKSLIVSWIDECLVPHLQQRAEGAPVYLLLDSYSGHWTEEVKEALNKIGVNTLKIPAGCTGLCQPVDVGIGKPLKDRIRQQWHSWLLNHFDPDASVLPTPSREQVSDWVLNALDEITPETIQNSWKKRDFNYF